MKHEWIFAPVSYDDVTNTYDEEHKFMAFEKGENGRWKEVSVWVDERMGLLYGPSMLIHIEQGTGTYFNERIKNLIETRMSGVVCRCMQ